MEMYEYLIINDQTDGSPDNEYELNELGKDGWELCAVRDIFDGSAKWYFKRIAKGSLTL